jgi:uncharacterized protein YbjT (DUF2867 family)
MKIVVIGGTGMIGARVVRDLRSAGHQAVAAARSTGVDILTGRGLASVLEDAHAVIDTSSPGYGASGEMRRFFEEAGATLLALERQAGIAHHVTFSAIGSDRIDSGYYRAKNAQEALIVASDIPFTIVRSAPLFEYVQDIVLAQSDRRTVRVPPVKLRPISADDAALALCRVALGSPENALVEIAGPDTYALSTLAEQLLTASEDVRPVVTEVAAPFFGARLGCEPLTGGMYPWIGATDFEGWLRRSLLPA